MTEVAEAIALDAPELTPEAAEAAPEVAAEAPDAAPEVAADAPDAAAEEAVIAADEAMEDADMAPEEAREEADEARLEVDDIIMEEEELDPAPPAVEFDPPLRRISWKAPSSRLARAPTRVIPAAWLLAQKFVKVRRVVLGPRVFVLAKPGS